MHTNRSKQQHAFRANIGACVELEPNCVHLCSPDNQPGQQTGQTCLPTTPTDQFMKQSFTNCHMSAYILSQVPTGVPIPGRLWGRSHPRCKHRLQHTSTACHGCQRLDVSCGARPWQMGPSICERGFRPFHRQWRKAVRRLTGAAPSPHI
jgi:hypothetical protein